MNLAYLSNRLLLGMKNLKYNREQIDVEHLLINN